MGENFYIDKSSVKTTIFTAYYVFVVLILHIWFLLFILHNGFVDHLHNLLLLFTLDGTYCVADVAYKYSDSSFCFVLVSLGWHQWYLI